MSDEKNKILESEDFSLWQKLNSKLCFVVVVGLLRGGEGNYFLGIYMLVR